MVILVTLLLFFTITKAHYSQPPRLLPQAQSCLCPPVSPCPPTPAPLCPPPAPPCLPPPCPPQYCPPPALCPPPQPILCPPPCPPPPPPCPPPLPCPPLPPCPMYCPPPSPCPLPISCPLPCPPPPPPCPSAISQPQSDSTGPVDYNNFRSFSDDAAESYRGIYDNRNINDGSFINGVEEENVIPHDFEPSKNAINDNYPYPRITVNRGIPESGSLFAPPAQQPLEQPSGAVYQSAAVSNENLLQQQQQNNLLANNNGRSPPILQSTIGGHAAGIRISVPRSNKFLIKNNCQQKTGQEDCDANEFTVAPENDCCTNCTVPCRLRHSRKSSLTIDQVREVDPICNSRLLRQIITEYTGNDSSKAKIQIQRAAQRHLGGLFGVICGTGNFAYSIQTDQFCQHRTDNITCYAFRPFNDHRKNASKSTFT